ncbi:hypothetical protein SDC9_143372 [bioreactor metagenome]|uniref:Uncharacterized protein n=1 Tax=bioreactor metagenome TaxID=1076179 RepID=A0A645E340_9ZZZZ
MDVLSAVERVDHPLVSADVREQPKFNLRVIRVDQQVSLGSNERLADFASQRRAHGDILHVWFGTRNAPRRGDALVKLRSDAVVLVADNIEQPVDKRAFKLREKAIF